MKDLLEKISSCIQYTCKDGRYKNHIFLFMPNPNPEYSKVSILFINEQLDAVCSPTYLKGLTENHKKEISDILLKKYKIKVNKITLPSEEYNTYLTWEHRGALCTNENKNHAFLWADRQMMLEKFFQINPYASLVFISHLKENSNDGKEIFFGG